ncbi:DUF2059 domain-containing protein [Flavobacterium sp. SM15]|uniref:DUF2059 domain-containing protein n=1 Tax=Flavobacterium sp. SM15 TaxID=2908005 RepID=UPI001EDA4B59|nr:DUF2059 domain-containing protein [Flavobacterium sp. SM15]MCG2609888.1 DUF2059 domain-containing protein [Flavobacterium sp. SM15]
MKKLFFVFALVLVANLGSAQTKEAFKSDVLKVLKVTASSQMNMAKTQILKMIPAEKQAAFLVEFDASLPSYYDKVAEVYMQEYTHDDIKQMLKFYDSPIGKKMTQKGDALTEKVTAAAQEWGAGLQGIMMKYMQ